MDAHLPCDKVQRLTFCFTEFKDRRSCTLKELQSLIGSLILLATLFPPAGHSCNVWSSSLGTSLYLTIVLSSLKILGCGRILHSIGLGRVFLCLLIGSLQMSCLCTQIPLVLWDLGAFFNPLVSGLTGTPSKTRSARDLYCTARIVCLCCCLSSMSQFFLKQVHSVFLWQWISCQYC